MKRRFVLFCLLTAVVPFMSPSVQASTHESLVQDAKPATYVDSPFPQYSMKMGSHGDAVKAIQQQLIADGYSIGMADGRFGPLTSKGVKAFQVAHHLQPDGIVGPNTWAALFPPERRVLLSRLQGYIQTRSSSVSVAVYNADNEETDVYNRYQTFDTASIVKPLILATLLHDSEVYHTSLSQWEKQLAVPMIEQSDNEDATRLWDQVGSAAGIQSFTRAANLDDTIPNPDGYWGLTTTSALDQVALVKDLALPNALIDARDGHYELNLMHNVTPWQGWGISSGVPQRDYVALKNGWLPLRDSDWEINSIGYVTGDGRNYMIAVLTSDNPTEAYGISTVEGISHIVWQTLGAQL